VEADDDVVGGWLDRFPRMVSVNRENVRRNDTNEFSGIICADVNGIPPNEGEGRKQ
jgi:hypothetical protein